MNVFSSCKLATQACMERQSFTVAHLYKEEKTMDMHIHDCYEIYYSISGGRQFLIDNKFYHVAPGDLFIINQFESHMLISVDGESHERIVVNLHPNFVKALSTEVTNLDECFSFHPAAFQHKISLSREQQNRFLYHIDKITSAEGYGADVIQRASVLELLVLVNWLSSCNAEQTAAPNYNHNHHVDDILSYINQNLVSDISMQVIADEFNMSKSYLCRVFKKATGTTIGKYVTARRITIARSLLSEGYSVTEAYEKSGFTDYSSFFKTFTRVVGISPKKYAILRQTV